jgi:hypothetical protein
VWKNIKETEAGVEKILKKQKQVWKNIKAGQR